MPSSSETSVAVSSGSDSAGAELVGSVSGSGSSGESGIFAEAKASGGWRRRQGKRCPNCSPGGLSKGVVGGAARAARATFSPKLGHPGDAAGARASAVRFVARVATRTLSSWRRLALMAGVDSVRFIAVEVAGKVSGSKLLHREDCFHLRDA